jgi:ribosome-associated protein
MPKLVIDGQWVVPEEDLELSYVRSSGPGGQNVNKVSTKVELRFKLSQSAALSMAQKRRLKATFSGHVTRGGDFVLSSDRFRSQVRNQEDVLDRLARMIRKIRVPAKRRVATKPTRASQQRRVQEKRQRGELKRMRRGSDVD